MSTIIQNYSPIPVFTSSVAYPNPTVIGDPSSYGDVLASSLYQVETVSASSTYEDEAVTVTSTYRDETVPASSTYEDETVPASSTYGDETVPASSTYGDETVPVSSILHPSSSTNQDEEIYSSRTLDVNVDEMIYSSAIIYTSSSIGIQNEDVFTHSFGDSTSHLHGRDDVSSSAVVINQMPSSNLDLTIDPTLSSAYDEDLYSSPVTTESLNGEVTAGKRRKRSIIDNVNFTSETKTAYTTTESYSDHHNDTDEINTQYVSTTWQYIVDAVKENQQNEGTSFINMTTNDNSGKPVDYYYKEAGHQLNDFIYDCIWQNQPCPPESLTSSITEMGNCYSFNVDTNYKTNKTGAGFGLTLFLNIEQYEYIKGGSNDAGIKVYLHPSNEIPLVKDLGISVSPGLHTLLAVKYSTQQSLGEPYGTCGKVDLSLFNDSESYTHGRCSRECITKSAIKRCNCKDAFMPGNYTTCTLEEYLSCIHQIKYEDGFELDNCSCPQACDVEHYDSDLSYASLSTLSINSLLTHNITKIKQSYNYAQEIQSRVRIKTFKQTIVNIREISTSLRKFAVVAEKKTPIIIRRVSRAIEEIYLLVKNDTESIIALLEKMEDAYWKYKGEHMSYYASAIEKLQESCQTYSLFPNEASMKMCAMNIIVVEKVFTSAYEKKNFDDKLIPGSLYLDSGKCSITKNLTKELNRLISSCESVIDGKTYSLLEYYYHIIMEYYDPYSDYYDCTQKSGCKWEQFLFRNLYHISPDYLSPTRVTPILNLIAVEKECVTEYGSKLHTTNQTIGNIYAIILEKFDEFTYEKILMNIDDDIVQIEEKATHYDDLLLRYSRNNITKLELSHYINENETIYIEQLMDSILARIDQLALTELRKSLGTLQKDISDIYDEIMEACRDINKYHNDTLIVLKEILDYQIWLKPEADMQSQQILQIKYKTQERIWPLEKTLDDFLDTNTHLEHLNGILSKYFEVVNDEFHTVEEKLITAKKEVLRKLSVVVNDLTKTREQSEINKDFVINNFLKMDIYFAALKYESIQQLKAYTEMNFLSEVGGYMGLLIGASAITVIELLDLLIYNVFLKAVDQRHRRRAVAPIINST